jgi:hypothetical protein
LLNPTTRLRFVRRCENGRYDTYGSLFDGRRLLRTAVLAALRPDQDDEPARTGNADAQQAAAPGVVRPFVGPQQRATPKALY